MLVDALANATLDAYLGNATLLGATVYVGLMTTAPANDGSGVVEPVGNAYARVAVVNNLTQWPSAVARSKTHANDITFPTATGTWGTCTHCGIFDSPTGGLLKIFDALTTPRLIVNTDTYRFLAGGVNALKLSV